MKIIKSRNILIVWLLLQSLVFLPVYAAGSLTYIEAHKDGVGGLDGLGEAHAVKISPDGKFAYVAAPSDDAIAVFSRNASSGKLTFVEKTKVGTGPLNADGAYWLTISPDGNHVYVADYDENAVMVFSRNSTDGTLTFVEKQEDGVGGVDGLAGAFAVEISPDGKHIYATGWTDGALAVFSRNSSDGTLTFVEKQSSTGMLGLGGMVDTVVISPDGKHVYAGSLSWNTLVVMSRNDTTGALTYVETKFDGVDSVDGLDGVRALAFSPDGKHLYVAGIRDDAIAVFSRNATTGALTYVETKFDGIDSVDGLDGAHGVTVSPDNQYVYVTAYYDNALTVFSRNSTSGVLTFLGTYKDGVGGVDGLDTATAVTTSSDGVYVYATSEVDSAVAVFGYWNQVYLPLVLKY